MGPGPIPKKECESPDYHVSYNLLLQVNVRKSIEAIVPVQQEEITQLKTDLEEAHESKLKLYKEREDLKVNRPIDKQVNFILHASDLRVFNIFLSVNQNNVSTQN